MGENERMESSDSFGVKPLFNVEWEGTVNPWEIRVAFSIVFVSINRKMVSAVARAAPFHALSSHELKNGHFIYSDAYTISH